MANMNWPTEKACKYPFRANQELDLVIPLENGKEKGKATNKSEVKGR